MTNILAIANQKGGVGKTTTCINLAAALSDLNKRVLVVDLDPQGNATMGLGVDSRGLELSACELLLGEADCPAVIRTGCAGGVDLVPANTDLTAAEVALVEREQGREQVLRQCLAPVENQYDFILIDCPPSLSILTINALVAARGVLIPMQCEYYALEGLASLLETIEGVRQTANPGLRIEGLLRTMFDARNNLANDVSAQLQNHFGDRVYRTIVPRNVRVAEAPSHGEPVIRYDRRSRGAIAYLGLAGEVLRRSRQTGEQHP